MKLVRVRAPAIPAGLAPTLAIRPEPDVEVDQSAAAPRSGRRSRAGLKES
jgi:hypothetical protein